MKAIGNIAATVIAMLMLAALAGCGGEPVKPSAENAKAMSALDTLEQMRSAYVARDIQGVLDHVSSGLEGGFSVFSAGVRKDMETYDEVELKFFIERVELAEDAVVAVFHWRGNWRDKDGKTVEGRGNSVFRFTGDTELKLGKVVGDSPFGIVW